MFGWIKESAVYEAGMIGSSSWDEESSSYKVQLPAEVLPEAARVMDKGYLFYVHGTIEAEGAESEFYLQANKKEANRILFAEGSTLTEGLLTISHFDLTHVETEVADLMNDVTDLKTDLTYNLDISSLAFEIGDIAFSADAGLVYRSSTTRVRTTRDSGISLSKGDKIAVSNANIRFFVFHYSEITGKWVQNGWNASSFNILESGVYSLLLRFDPEETITDISSITNYLSITHTINVNDIKTAFDNADAKIGNNASAISSINNNLMYYYDNSLLQLELGDIAFNPNVGPIYRVSTTRVRTTRNGNIDLKKGSKIIITNPNIAFYVFYYSNEQNKWVQNGWLSDEYTIPENASYALLFRYNPEAEITDISTITDYLKISITFSAVNTYNEINDINSEIESLNGIRVNDNIRSIGHRGWMTTMPENTLMSFKEAVRQGCNYLETDIQFTADGIPVLLHDNTINATARNSDGSEIAETISINNITYEQALSYDFGIYKGQQFAGTKIPKFEELIYLCKSTGTKMYVELKNDGNYTIEQIKSLMNLVKAYDMFSATSWISFSTTYILNVVTIDPSASVGFVANPLTEAKKEQALKYKENGATVFFDLDYNYITDEDVSFSMANGIPIDAWTYTTEADIKNANKFIRGYTANGLVASKILYDEVMGN